MKFINEEIRERETKEEIGGGGIGRREMGRRGGNKGAGGGETRRERLSVVRLFKSLTLTGKIEKSFLACNSAQT